MAGANTQRKRLRGRHVAGLIVLALMVLGVVAFFTVPAFRSKVTQILMLFRAPNVQSMVGYFHSCGSFAAPASLLLMTVQAVVPPFPMSVVVYANASMFGCVQGALLSWAGSLLGALACFTIVRALGRGIVERFVTPRMPQAVVGFIERQGMLIVMVCELLPFMPFDLVSYLAGLTSLRVRDFLLGAAVGQLPAILVCSYAGKALDTDAAMIETVVLTVLAVTVLAIVVKRARNANGK